MGTVFVTGNLVFERVKKTHSEALVKAAMLDGFTLPVISEGLSSGAYKKLVSATSVKAGFWFIGERGDTHFTSTGIKYVSDIGAADDFKNVLNTIISIVEEDGGVVSGTFVLEGNNQGDVERWKIADNEVSVEKIIMVWPDGEIYRPVSRSARW